MSPESSRRRERQRYGTAFTSWHMMLQRVRNPNNPDYQHYGGRGITVDDAWNPQEGGSYAQFLEDVGDRPDGMTLDRIDVNGNYEPSNVRWATPKEQRRNQRRAHV